jgi:hypothetical protein
MAMSSMSYGASDQSLLVMPGNIPLDSQAVRTEITRQLPDGWSG